MKLLQLQKKYPNAYYNFIAYFRKRQPRSMCQEVYEMMDRVKDYCVRGWWKEITDFMDKQGIKIYAYPNGRLWTYVIIGVFRIERGLKNRQQAETKAIEKAFQILEGRTTK